MSIWSWPQNLFYWGIFFLIYLSLTTSRICYNSFFLPFPLLILPGLALHRQSRADPGSSPAPRAAHKPHVTWSGCSWILFPKGEFIQECLCYLKTLSHPFKARANGGAGFGSVEQTGEEKGRERWEWERRASFVCYFPTKQKLYEYLDELLDTSSHLLLKKIFLFVESVIFLDAWRSDRYIWWLQCSDHFCLSRKILIPGTQSVAEFNLNCG